MGGLFETSARVRNVYPAEERESSGMEKQIILASYDTDFITWQGRKIPISVVTGIRLDENGNITWLSLDSNSYSDYLNGKGVVGLDLRAESN
ncbi:MAG TPA: hypothetical protein VIY48_16025 [Candidatus Paceibacterota bacterium]